MPVGAPSAAALAPAFRLRREVSGTLRLRSIPIAQTITVERVKNASTWASTFKSRWITPGLVNYKDVDGGVGYVSKETIDASMSTMVGRPLVIKHEPISKATGEKIDPVRPSNMEEVASGYISRVWYDPADGWYWCEGTVHDDEAKRLIRSGWRVSCCYGAVGALGPAGKLHGMPYDFQVRQFNGEHLALHPNPRYEGATIIMNAKSAKPSAAMSFKLFGKKTEPTAAEKAATQKAADEAAAETLRLANANKEAVEVGPETAIEYAEGKTATIGELVESHLTVQNGAEMDPECEIEYADGKRAKMGHILKHYANAMDLEEKQKKEIEEKTSTGTSGLSFSHAKKGEEKKGEKAPNYLRLVHAQTDHANRMILKNAGKQPETQQARIERGRSRWGRPSTSAAVAASKN